MSGNPSTATTALIAIGSSLVGGVSGGIISLFAARVQHRHDVEVARTARSIEASKRVLGDVVQLDQGVAQWIMLPGLAGSARESYNRLAASFATSGPEILDSDVQSRLLTHVRLCGTAIAVITETNRPLDNVGRALLEALRRHSDATQDAVSAYVGGRPLPPYEAPDLMSVDSILKWRNAAL